jgi:hypothetical protein
MEQLFIKASREKWRFQTTKGEVMVEDLWDYETDSDRPNVTTLDTIAVAIDQQLTNAPKKSFVKTRSSANIKLELQLELLKYIIQVKMEEKAAKNLRKAQLEKLSLLRELEAEDQIKALKEMSPEERKKMIAELEG